MLTMRATFHLNDDRHVAVTFEDATYDGLMYQWARRMKAWPCDVISSVCYPILDAEKPGVHRES